MIEVTIHEAKTQLSRLIKAVLEGEEVLISNRNRPVARLVAVEARCAERRLGWGGTEGMWMADDFDAPLDDFTEHM
jgi:prevent-host-death family protein